MIDLIQEMLYSWSNIDGQMEGKSITFIQLFRFFSFQIEYAFIFFVVVPFSIDLDPFFGIEIIFHSVVCSHWTRQKKHRCDSIQWIWGVFGLIGAIIISACELLFVICGCTVNAVDGHWFLLSGINKSKPSTNSIDRWQYWMVFFFFFMRHNCSHLESRIF